MDFSIKSLAKNSSVLLISQIILKLLNFLLLPVYTHYLSPADYGISNLILDFALILYYIFSFSIDSGMSVFFHDEETEIHRRRIFTNSFNLALIGAGICLVISSASGLISKVLFQSLDYSALVFMGFIIAAARILYFAPNVNFRLRNNVKTVAIIECCALTVTLLLNILLIAYFKIGFIALIISPMIAELLKLTVFLILARRFFDDVRINPTLMKTLFSYSIAFVPAMLLSVIIKLSDQFIINHFHGEYQVGLYAVASKIIGVLSIPGYAFLTAYTAYAHANAKKESGPASFSFLVNVVFLGMACVTIGIGILSKDILKLMTSEAYHSAYPAAAFLALSYVTYTLGSMLEYGLAFEKKKSLVLLITICTSFFNVIGNIVLIPRYGYIAASLTSLASYLLRMCLNYYLAQRYYPCPYQFKKILILTLCLLCVITVSLSLSLVWRAVIIILAISVLIALYRKEVGRILSGVKNLSVIRKLTNKTRQRNT